MKILIRENLPRWYGLSWQASPPTLLLHLHRDFLPTVEPIAEEIPLVRSLKSEFKFTSFDWTFKEGFGFDGAFVLQEEGEFQTFGARLPAVFQFTNQDCNFCGGSGEDEFRDDKCLFCHGSGKADTMKWEPAFAISVSLNLLLNPACFFDGVTSAKTPQLLTVRLVSKHGMNGSGLSGFYSIPLVEWLTRCRRGASISEMTEAMDIAYTHMLLASYVESHDFRATVEGERARLNVSCPGNACGLSPHYHGPQPGQGYEFSSHNIDSPTQQLTLLAGLAALHDRVDRELWPQ